MFKRVLNNTNSYFDEYFSPKSADLMQNTRPLFNNPLSHPTIKLKQVLENYRFCRNSGNDTYGKGMGGHLVYVIMMYCVRKSTCDNSPLIHNPTS